jgi:dihydroneopterin aldolase
MPTRDAITLRGMRFHTLVGVLPHERDVAQPLEVDVTVWLPPMGDAAHEAALDYRELYDLTADAVGGHHGYLETMAATIASRALARDRVERVRVAVRKPHVALPGPLAFAEVVVERERAPSSPPRAASRARRG